MKEYQRLLLTLSIFALIGCDASESGIKNHDEMQRYVSKHMVGNAPDHWIEIKNMAGEWERVGLVFGYLDDFDECQKAIAGMKEVNFAREYRCVPANG